MERAFSYGNSVVNIGHNTVSILSRRAAFLVYQKSQRDTWKHRIVPFQGAVVKGGFIFIGWQPYTGYLIAFKAV